MKISASSVVFVYHVVCLSVYALDLTIQ